MPLLAEFPVEVLDMIMAFLDVDSEGRSPFFYSKKFSKSALQASYNNLRVTIWDPSSSLALATPIGRHTEWAIRKRLLVVFLLSRAMPNTGPSRTLERAKIVSIRLAEENPIFLKELCLPTRSPMTFLNPLNVTKWDRWLRDIFRRTTLATHMTFDWLGAMPLTSGQGQPAYWQDYSHLRHLTIRGVRDDLDQYYSFIHFHPSLPLQHCRFETLRLENVQLVRQFTVAEMDARLKAKPKVAIAKYKNRTWRLELIDCKAIDMCDRSKRGISEAKVVFSHGQFHGNVLTALCSSREILTTLELMAQYPLPTTDGLRQRALIKCYRYICRRFHCLKHLTVSFWIEPYDDAWLYGLCIPQLTHLTLSISMDDVVNNFDQRLMEKLAIIEDLGLMPALKCINLHPSPWVTSAPALAHRRPLEALLKRIRDAWANQGTTHVFGWRKSTAPTGNGDVFKWAHGHAIIDLDFTTISAYVERLWLLASEMWLCEFRGL